MKLIDVNRLRDAVLALPNCYNGYSDTYDKSLIIGLIDEQIVVDAVPVVRCVECKHYLDEDQKGCDLTYSIIKPNDYCSYGERKENGDDRHVSL